MANTPWELWSAAGKEKKDLHVAQGSLSATMDDNRRHRVNEHIKDKQHAGFGSKAWMQSDRNNNAWVTTCPKEQSSLSAGQFLVVCQTCLLRGAADMPRGTEKTPYLAKIWAEREEESEDGVRYVRRESGQSDFARRRMDVPS